MARSLPVRLALAAGTALALVLVVPGTPRASADDAPAAGHAETGVAFEAPGWKWTDLAAKAEKDGKPIFLDFYTSWCGWCKRLDKDTFSQASVAQLMKALVCVHADAEDKGEGQALAKKYGANGYPTLVVVDAKGEEVDRIVGYLPPDPFAKEIQRILKGEGTLPALKKAVADKPDDLALALKLGEKLMASNEEDGTKLLEDVAAKAKGKDRTVEGRAWAALAQAALERRDLAKAMPLLEKVATEFGDVEGAAEATRMLVMMKVGANQDFDGALAYAAKLREKAKDGKLPGEVEQVIASLHLGAASQALERAAAAAGDDPQKLNAIAWTAFQQRLSMKKAVAWATTAAEKSSRDPAILDTLANLLFETGKVEEAVKVELEALEKVTQPAMKVEFAQTLARFKATLESRQAMAGSGHETIPATPIAPAPEKKPDAKPDAKPAEGGK